MKRILFCLIFLLLFAGCSDAAGKDRHSDASSDDNSYRYMEIKTEVEDGIEIVEAEGDLNAICDDSLIFILDSDVQKAIHPIKTNKEAVTVAKAILEKERTERNAVGKDFDYQLFLIIHFPKDNLWCFAYASEDVISSNADGNDWCVAIDGNSGRLIKAWGEE